MELGIQYLLEASVKLVSSQNTKVRAMILYHHFQAITAHDEVKYDEAMVAAAALNLSSKIGEEVIDLDTLVLLFYCIVKKTDEVLDSDDASFILLRKSLVTVEFIMQRMLEFTLNHQLAHQYLLPFLELVFARSSKIAGYHQAMSEACLSLMTDFYTNKKCLNYNPEHIAVACIDAAIHMFKLEKNTEMIDPWYEGLCSDLTSEKVNEIKHDVFLVYKEGAPQPKSPTVQPAETEDTRTSRDSAEYNRTTIELVELEDNRRTSIETVEEDNDRISGQLVEAEDIGASRQFVEAEDDMASRETVEAEDNRTSGELVETEDNRRSIELVESDDDMTSGEPVKTEENSSSRKRVESEDNSDVTVELEKDITVEEIQPRVRVIEEIVLD